MALLHSTVVTSSGPLLAEILMHDAGVTSLQLCRKMIGKASSLLQQNLQTESCGAEFPHELALQYLETLRPLLQSLSSDDLSEVAEKVVHDICIPYLGKIPVSSDCSGKGSVTMVAKLLGSILLCDRSLSRRSWIITDVLIPMSCPSRPEGIHSRVQPTGTKLPEVEFDAQLLVILIQQVFEVADIRELEQSPDCDSALSTLYENLIRCLQCWDSGACFLLLSCLLPSFITSPHLERVEDAWRFIESVASSKTAVECSETDLVLTMLCCFSDVFIHHDKASPFGSSFHKEVVTQKSPILDLRTKESFWLIAQEGLVSSDPLSRKRCKYLLLRVLMSVQESCEETLTSPGWVFWWSKYSREELQVVWDDLVLILETMEEKQVHIVKPVQNRLKHLITATSKHIDGHSLLHVSWLMIALSQIFVHHEAKSVIRWGVQELLDMPLQNSPLLQLEHWKFLFGPVMQVLNENLIYAREPNACHDVAPPIACSLSNFLSRFVQELPSELRGVFLTQFIQACSTLRLREIALFFICYAVFQLPSSHLLGPEALAAISLKWVYYVKQMLGFSTVTLLRVDSIFYLVTNYYLPVKVCRADLSPYPQDHFESCHSMLLAYSCLQTHRPMNYNDVVLTLGSFRADECFTFGSYAWKEAGDWVTKLYAQESNNRDDSESSLFDYLKHLVQHCIKESVESTSPPSPAYLARIILLITDTECRSSTVSLLSTKERTLEDSLTLLLASVMEIISGARSHVYMPGNVVHNAVDLLTSTLSFFLGGSALSSCELWEGNRSPTGGLLYRCLHPWLQSVMIYFQEEVLVGSKDGIVSGVDHVSFYINALDQLYHFMMLFGFPFHSNQDIGPIYIVKKATDKLSSLCIKEDVELTSTLLGALTALAWVCNLLTVKDVYQSSHKWSLEYCTSVTVECISKLPANLRIIKPTTELLHTHTLHSTTTSDPGIAQKLIDWGPLLSHCFVSHWHCVLFALRQLCGDMPQPCYKSSAGSRPDKLILGRADAVAFAEVCVNRLDVGGKDIAIVIECLSLLVEKLLTVDCEFLIGTIDTMWPLVLEQREHHRAFWKALKAFLMVAFHPVLLRSSASPVVEMQQKYASEFFEIGETRTGIYNLLVTHVCTTWLKHFKYTPQQVTSSLMAHMELILQACMFGPVFKKNLRTIEDVESFVESLGNACSSNSLTFGYLEGDNSVRVCVLSFLVEVVSVSKRDSQHETSDAVRESFLPKLVESILQKIASISALKPKYYINSLTHRSKLRLSQTLFLMLEWVNKSTAHMIATQLLQALQSDNQLSVRYMMEWIVVLVLNKYPEFLDTLFYPLLQHDSEMRLSRMCSIFTIAVHVGDGWETTEDKISYYLRVFPAVYQWTTSHHFVARMYAQQAVVTIWEACHTAGLQQVLDGFKLLSGCIDFMKWNSDAARFKQKVESNVFFSNIRTGSDVCIEVVFHILPKLSSVINEELISAGEFERGSPLWRHSDPPLAVHCTNKNLLAALLDLDNETSQKSGVETRSFAHQLKSETVKMDTISEVIGDVQKKITPWSNPTSVLNELFSKQSPHSLQHSTRTQSNLILVASLLYKAPNLGGLCRTCEIFGVSELVLSNMQLLEEKQFQSLSVTAEKWIPLTEVKLPMLKEYLLALQREGYALVGVEQTAQSKCVTKYQFQKKTVLVLGNEREGIPVEIIHLLDDCVEIPQFGVIRSLNVHVSGALLIWEYTKQHLLTD